LRSRVLYRVLDKLERGILYLSSRILDHVQSKVLQIQILEIIAKLEDAMRSRFYKHVETYGCKQAVQIVRVALRLGNMVARDWLLGVDFARYLAFINMNQPIGYS